MFCWKRRHRGGEKKSFFWSWPKNHFPLMTYQWKMSWNDDIHLLFPQILLWKSAIMSSMDLLWRLTFPKALQWCLDWSSVERAACGPQAFSRVVVPELARHPLAPPRCGSLSIIKVGSARASGAGSFINWITHKINVHLLQRSNGLLPLAEIISAGLHMTAKGSAQWMGRFAALHTKWIVHHCLIKRLLETLVSSPLDSKP